MSDDHKTKAQQFYRGKAARNGIFVGTGRGHIVTKFEAKRARPGLLCRKKKINAKTKLMREVIGEVAGLSPYEKRLLEVLKTGGTNAEKKLYKMAKQRLGSHKRAQKKRDYIKKVAQDMAKKGIK